MAGKLELYSATHKSVPVSVGKYKENPDRSKNQSDCSIRYRGLWEKINIKSANTFDSVGIIWIVKIKWIKISKGSLDFLSCKRKGRFTGAQELSQLLSALNV